MIIQRRSPIDGSVNEMNLDVTQEQFDDYYVRRKLLQDAFPHLSPGEREFIKTGITPEQWEKVFG